MRSATCLLLLLIFLQGCKKSDDEPAPTGGGGPSNVVHDIDGNPYTIVTIGAHRWLREDLRTTRYANGDPIPEVVSASTWAVLDSGAWCRYDNNVAYEDTFGLLYNWYTAVDPRKVCPNGWHVPSMDEFQELADGLGGVSVAGGALKDTTIWDPPNTGATNASGFTGLPGGDRLPDGAFASVGKNGWWWSTHEYNATMAGTMYFSHSWPDAFFIDFMKKSGQCIRCLED